ncbi:MAG: GAF domain-containing protein [Oligoflexia bacterium]|nr:GAF domain-containing protein [Oligoflexia bacterium]
MSEGAKKLDAKEIVSKKESSAKDRETALAEQFEDIGLVELIPDEPSSSGGSSELLTEVADAVEELVFSDAKVEDHELERVPLDQIASEVEADKDDHFCIEHIQTDSTMVIEKDIAPAEEANLIEDPILAIDRSGIQQDSEVNPNEIAKRLFSLVLCEKSFNDLVEEALQIYLDGLSAVAGSILELDIETNEFFFRSAIGGGDPEKLKAFRVPNGKGIVGNVATSGDFLLLSESSADAIQLKAISMSTGFEISSCLAGPIYIRGKLFGVIELFNKKDGYFNYDDKIKLEECIHFLEKVLEVRFFVSYLFRSLKHE